METYKLGNEIKCIIRSYAAGPIGNTVALYDNQPYTILKDVSATIRFKDQNSNIGKGVKNLLSYNTNAIEDIQISNVLLTDKIINLIFDQVESKLCTVAENFESDNNGNVFISCPQDIIYNVFTYNENGDLETDSSFFSFDLSQSNFKVQEPNAPYMIVYSYEGQNAVSLTAPNHLYVTLDLELVSNIDNETSKMFIHLDKCGIKADKNLYFNQNINSVDLTFTVIDNGTTNNYIVLKD